MAIKPESNGTTALRKTPSRRRCTIAVYPLEARVSVIDAYERGNDWREVAKANGVNLITTRGWVSKPNPSRFPNPRDGKKPRTLSEAEIDQLSECLSDDPSTTLQSFKTRILAGFAKVVSTTTVPNYLDGSLYAVGKPCRKQEPVSAEDH
ncbi:hypothetical protein CRM22_008185 [Opisthorchis felineus]|uniref:Uncharacterized protein n=1 Tax=Opisthorchis felineus TaxID=147828 RepID=A0A4V3SDK6_OPIFE|nr:hypothetical protein CRM22_008185 [Opisthorchis felineus]